jgi:hypothetical protein
MPEFLDGGDRRLIAWVAAIMVALLAIAYVLQPAAGQPIGIPSSYSSAWLGAKAAFLLLQQSGYQVERWIESPEQLPENSAGMTLIFAEPTLRGSANEKAAVVRFVSDGGRLLVFGASGAAFAPLSSSKGIPDSDLTPKPFEAILPMALSRNAPEVTMVAPDQWKTLRGGQLSIYAKDGQPGVVWYRFGKGQVIWWAISSPLSNGSLREKGNLALFLNSVGRSSNRILWDEYFHGERRSLTSYFSKTPLPWAGLQLFCIFAAMLFTFSRHWGPVRAPLSESRLSPMEFVNALGDLYESAHASPSAVGIAYQRLRSSLTRKLSLPAATKLAELSQAAAGRFGWSKDALFDTLLHAERAMRDIEPNDDEALDLIRQLQRFTQELEPSKSSKESPNWK